MENISAWLCCFNNPINTVWSVFGFCLCVFVQVVLRGFVVGDLHPGWVAISGDPSGGTLQAVERRTPDGQTCQLHAWAVSVWTDDGHTLTLDPFSRFTAFWVTWIDWLQSNGLGLALTFDLSGTWSWGSAGTPSRLRGPPSDSWWKTWTGFCPWLPLMWVKVMVLFQDERWSCWAGSSKNGSRIVLVLKLLFC